MTYTKTAAGSWDYDVTIPSADLSATSTTANPVATGTLAFDSSGHLSTPDRASGAIAISIAGLADAAADMSLTWNLYDANGNPQVTQYDQASANLASAQNGTQAGQLTGISIGTNGQLTAAYTNGDKVPVAQLAVATVLNPESMQDLGNNTFGVTSATSVRPSAPPGAGRAAKSVAGRSKLRLSISRQSSRTFSSINAAIRPIPRS